MRLWSSLLSKLKLRRTPPEITRRQAMQVRPLRNPTLEWKHNEEGNVVATLTRRAGLKGKVITFFLAVPEARPIVLDEVGSFVWDMCDGQHSVEQIVEALRQKYKLSRREVEISLNEYLRMLGKRGMIAVAVPRELMAELSEGTKRTLGIQELASAEEADSDSAGDNAHDPVDNTTGAVESSDPPAPDDS